MEFVFETTYDLKALTAVAKGLRKTVRKKKSRCSRLLGMILVLLSLFLALFTPPTSRTLLLLIVALLITAVLCFEDSLIGYIAKKRMLPGTNLQTSRFTDVSYHSVTDVGTTEFHYDRIVAIAESKDYFIFTFSDKHAQVHNKHTISGGSLDDFRFFIQQKTNLTIVQI